MINNNENNNILNNQEDSSNNANNKGNLKKVFTKEEFNINNKINEEEDEYNKSQDIQYEKITKNSKINTNVHQSTNNEKNRVRNLIRAYFPERDCYVMVRPTEDEQDLQNLQMLPDKKFRKEFLEQSKIFRNKVLKKKKIKIKMYKN